MKHVLFFSGLILLFTSSLLVTDINLQEIWPVPEKYEKMISPIGKDDKEALTVGKDLYNKHCRSCHGKKGLGDGPTAAQLIGDPKDFTETTFKAQSDGSIFYKAWTGRNEMPSFEKRITDEEDLWSLVNYLRTLE